METEPLTIGQLAERAGITQPSATQTVALMTQDRLLSSEPGERDGRRKFIRLSETGLELLPKLKTCWKATAMAASRLEADLPFSLSQVLESAIKALGTKPFEVRIREARTELNKRSLPAISREHQTNRRSPREPSAARKRVKK